MCNKYKYIVIAGLLVLLVLVRVYERELFYDPFLDFFNNASQNKALPKYNGFKLFFDIFNRYLINSGCTLLIIFILFKKKSIVKITFIMLSSFFVILSLVFFFLLEYTKTPDLLILFYIRRFLIQPLFLILFVPAFFYQISVNKQ
jgi:exosortase F-associated protein